MEHKSCVFGNRASCRAQNRDSAGEALAGPTGKMPVLYDAVAQGGVLTD